MEDIDIDNILESHELEDQRDEMCDPENPRVSSFQEISAAAYRIRSGVLRTPCTVSLSEQ